MKRSRITHANPNAESNAKSNANPQIQCTQVANTNPVIPSRLFKPIELLVKDHPARYLECIEDVIMEPALH